jgi:hypothetical protein
VESSDSPVIHNLYQTGDVQLLQEVAVDPDSDILALRWTIDGATEGSQLIFYENMAPCLTWTEAIPVLACFDDGSKDYGAVWLPSMDGIVHFPPAAAGGNFDWATFEQPEEELDEGFAVQAEELGDGVCLAIGGLAVSDGHQLGLDGNEICGLGFEHQPEDAFDDAMDGELFRSNLAACHLTGAISWPIARDHRHLLL